MLGIWGGTLVHIILAIIGLSAVITASAWWSDWHWWVSKINGGGEGFEPPKGVSSLNDLANRRLQPLGHPSAKSGYGKTPHGVCPF